MLPCTLPPLTIIQYLAGPCGASFVLDTASPCVCLADYVYPGIYPYSVIVIVPSNSLKTLRVKTYDIPGTPFEAVVRCSP